MCYAMPNIEKNIIEVLKIYKKNPCLWDSKNKYYRNKLLKNVAWAKILQVWRKFEPNATTYDIKFKITNMRTNYTRQRRKVEYNAQSGDSYKPSLWYYEHMNFLSGKNNESSSDDSDTDNETLYVVPTVRKRPASESNDTETSTDIVEVSSSAFGRSVGAQLYHLSKIQRCIAEKLISNVIYHAKMEQLTMATCIHINEKTSQADHFGTNNIVISKTEASWYDGSESNGSGQQSSSICTFISNEEIMSKDTDNETENAVNFIKTELEESKNYCYDEELDKQSTDIIVKEELDIMIEP